MTKEKEIILRRGVKVVCKNDPSKKVGTVISSPPAMIGNPNKPSGVFPLVLHNRVYVMFPTNGKMFSCMERIDNLEIATPKQIKDFNSSSYPKPIVEHRFARKRALECYQNGIGQ